MSIFDALSEIKKILSVVNVKTVKLGLEPNISPSDYPIIRIVAGNSEISTGFDGWSENFDFKVYCGYKLDEKIGVENIYKQIYTLENEIKFLLHNTQIFDGAGLIKFQNTVSDEDTLKNFKVLCLSFRICEMRFMQP